MANALILTTSGINCDRELAHAFELAGASPALVHLNRLLEEPELIEEFDLIGLPGGFSYGDAIGAGRIAAALMRKRLYPALVAAIERGVPMIAPCNGFQIAVQIGLLPGPGPGEPWPPAAPVAEAALAPNESGRFVDRWCAVEVSPDSRCVWTRGLEAQGHAAVLPVAHGEGRFIPGDERLLERLEQSGQVAVRYAPADNPNGSVGDVAGICDASGLVLGLMPHPERFVRWDQHPVWTRLPQSERSAEPLGMRMFRNAVARAGKTAAV